MPETIHEQIAQWIAAALDGQQDPEAVLTLRAVRPKILDWTFNDFNHGDVVITAESLATQSYAATVSRGELAIWKCSGVIRELPAETAADTVISRMIETIRRLLLAGNSAGTACGVKAVHIDCPEAETWLMAGGVVAEVTVHVTYRTAVFDGFTQA